MTITFTKADNTMTQKNSHSLCILPGDGIGPEIVAEARKVIDWLHNEGETSFDIKEEHIGGASYDAYGEPITEDTISLAKSCDAVLLGAVGGPQWDNVAYDKRPEAGLLTIRKKLDLFANLRPAIVFDALADASSLKKEIVQGLDILIVRELTGGVYFGEPRGIEDLGNGQRRGFNTQTYTTEEIQRVGRIAFDLAKKREGKVTSCEKANVMESGKLWREEITALHQAEFADVQLEHMYADNCAMQLVRAPSQFDVIVTDNLFGDILSDEAAQLTGSLGMLPSASLGSEYAMYEPAHGSAPDIAGQQKANPLATILSFAMALRYSFDNGEAADALEAAVQDVLGQGIRTADIMSLDCQEVSTPGMGDAILEALSKGKQARAA